MSSANDKSQVIRESENDGISGITVLLLLLGLAILFGWWAISSAIGLNQGGGSVLQLVASILLLAVDLTLLAGLYVVNPNEGKVLQLFGDYRGTSRSAGLRWANPFYSKHKVSMRVRNFETGKLKVNDKRGNPIEIAAVVVWKVTDTAEAVFMVDDYENYVHVQSEAAGRNLAGAYPYDVYDEGEISLVSHTAEISERLRHEIQERLDKAGVEVIEARISHMAYAAEIASAMLQRQQAHAVIAARRTIVEGAVGMVEMAIEMLSTRKVLTLDDERKSAMVSNLLVVLCAEGRPTPVINAGSLYTG